MCKVSWIKIYKMKQDEQDKSRETERPPVHLEKFCKSFMKLSAREH